MYRFLQPSSTVYVFIAFILKLKFFFLYFCTPYVRSFSLLFFLFFFEQFIDLFYTYLFRLYTFEGFLSHFFIFKFFIFRFFFLIFRLPTVQYLNDYFSKVFSYWLRKKVVNESDVLEPWVYREVCFVWDSFNYFNGILIGEDFLSIVAYKRLAGKYARSFSSVLFALLIILIFFFHLCVHCYFPFHVLTYVMMLPTIDHLEVLDTYVYVGLKTIVQKPIYFWVKFKIFFWDCFIECVLQVLIFLTYGLEGRKTF